MIREVTRPDAKVSCTAGDGQENTDDGTAREEQKTGRPAPRLVERKTELRGLYIAPSRENKSTIRRRSGQETLLGL
jgi:hypothetical protein